MKVTQKLFTAFAVAFGIAALTATSASAQGIKLAVVDMQRALDDYNRTKEEVKKINDFGKSKSQGIDDKRASAKKIADQAKAVGQIAADSSKNEPTRKEAAEKYNGFMKELNAVSKEIAEEERKASQELLKARQEMEGALVADIRAVMEGLAKSKGVDLIFDKSFLPKANKAIIYTSGNVIDLTEEIISTLNK